MRHGRRRRRRLVSAGAADGATSWANHHRADESDSNPNVWNEMRPTSIYETDKSVLYKVRK